MRLKVFGALAVVLALRPGGGRAEEPPPSDKPAGPPINIYLKGPADLGDFLKTITKPDFILLTGEEWKAQLEQARQGRSATDPWTAVLRSVALHGKVDGDLAKLTLEARVQASGPGPNWVSLRLDGQTVTGAFEGDQPRRLQVDPSGAGGWQVEVQGSGEHTLRVELKVRLGSTTEGHRLQLAIPEVPETEVRLDVDRTVSEAWAGATDASSGGAEPVECQPTEEGRATRLIAHLSPRSRLDLTWKIETDPAAQLPPLLSMQGEIAIDVNPGSLRTRSSWLIKSVRGASRSLNLRLAPEDEVLELSLDGQPVPTALEPVDGAIRLTIQLTDPLRPGPTKRLVMSTRRALPPQGPAKLTFRGFALENAKEQSGAVGIVQQGGNLFVSGPAGRGLLQIDPRTELPSDLRARPSTVLAYRFDDQPFDLDLRIDPSPPLVRTEASTTVLLDAKQARVDTWLRAEAAHGRLFDLHVVLPPGLQLESVGPKEVVESQQLASEADGARLLTLRLASRAQEGTAFRIHLTGRQAIAPAQPVDIALFRPRESASGGGRVAVVVERNLTADLAERDASSDVLATFRPALQAPPSDWPWPEDRPEPATGAALWLRYDGNPAKLPLRVVAHPRSLSTETDLSVEVGRLGIETRQETNCNVHFGTLENVDIEVPRTLARRWELEDSNLASRIDLGETATGGRLVRLKFARPVTGKLSLAFHIRQPLAVPLQPDKASELEVDWIRFRDGQSEPPRARVKADFGVRLEVRSSEWARVEGGEGSSPPEEAGEPLRLTISDPRDEPINAPLLLTATAPAMSALPPLVASRLWLRTIQGPDNELRTTAAFRLETHPGAIAVALPSDAKLVRARVNGEAIAQVEHSPRSERYRFRLPRRLGLGTASFEIEYTSPGRPRSAWDPPHLLDDGVVQQTLWEVRVPSGRALVGIPRGWADENRWYWDYYVWKRHPWKSAAALAIWSGTTIGNPKAAEEWESDGRDGYHSYLFGQPGPPSELRPLIASRAELVAIFSGAAFGLGVLILYLRPPFRLLGTISLALGLALGMALVPVGTILAIQSAAVGLVFTLVAAVMKRFVERPRRSVAAVFGDPGTPPAPLPPGSSVSRPSPLDVGSDESTAIRVRAASTIDHLPVATSSGPESATGRTPTR